MPDHSKPDRRSRDEGTLAPPDHQPPNLSVPDPGGRKIGWAIVGLEVLALEGIMPAFADCQHSQPVALVSDHVDKAKRVVEAYRMDSAKIYHYENYDTMADNPDVDAIFIVLPNDGTLKPAFDWTNEIGGDALR